MSNLSPAFDDIRRDLDVPPPHAESPLPSPEQLERDNVESRQAVHDQQSQSTVSLNK